MEEIKILNSFIENDLTAIREMRMLEECLELRLHFLHPNNMQKTEFEKNEDTITRIKTEIEINRLKKIIVQKTHDLNDNLKIYAQELQEEEQNK
jgi:hypothetical protein